MQAVAGPVEVLVVEDSPAHFRLIEAMLADSRVRYSTRSAPTLKAALELLRADGIDAVLLDLDLPDSCGLKTLERVRAAAPTTPVLVLTVDDDEDLAAKALQAGAQDYLIKGADAATLKRALRHAMERGRSERAMRDSDRRFRTIFENAAVGIAVVDPTGILVEGNRALDDFLGMAPGGTRGRQVAGMTHPDDTIVTERLRAQLRSGERDAVQVEVRCIRADGALVWARLTISAVRDPQGQLLFTIAIIEDIHVRKELEDRMRLAGTVIDSIGEGVFLTDADWIVRFVNPAFSEISGFAAEEVIGQKSALVAGEGLDPASIAKVNQALALTGKWTGEVWNRRKSGEVYAEWLSVTAVRDPSGKIRDHVAIISDVTNRKLDRERLAYRANHDALTGLPNRTFFRERLSRALARAQRTQREVGLFFLDLDRFKEVNDTLGHHVGDLLLQEIAARLGAGMRQGDTLARLAGDEFTIILEDLVDFRDAAIVAQKVLRQCTEHFLLEGHDVQISASIGIALFPIDGEDVDTLLQASDVAMYRAKKQGKNNYQFHAPQLNERAFERKALESSLRGALRQEELEVYFQPVVEIESGRILGAEALLRWRHPDYGLVLPGQFLATAESAGLTGEITRFVLTQACAQAGAWARAGHDLSISVNLARHDLHQMPIEDYAIEAMRAGGVAHGRLEIELPETALGDLRGLLGKTLKSMRAAGIRVAIDDFGAGYSTFGNLKRLPIDTVKIDASFVRDILIDPEDARIVSAIAAAARSLNLTVVAKGVETDEQLAFLIGSQCQVGQGFLFGAPMPADRFMALLARKDGSEPAG